MKQSDHFCERIDPLSLKEKSCERKVAPSFARVTTMAEVSVENSAVLPKVELDSSLTGDDILALATACYEREGSCGTSNSPSTWPEATTTGGTQYSANFSVMDLKNIWGGGGEQTSTAGPMFFGLVPGVSCSNDLPSDNQAESANLAAEWPSSIPQSISPIPQQGTVVNTSPPSTSPQAPVPTRTGSQQLESPSGIVQQTNYSFNIATSSLNITNMQSQKVSSCSKLSPNASAFNTAVAPPSYSMAKCGSQPPMVKSQSGGGWQQQKQHGPPPYSRSRPTTVSQQGAQYQLEPNVRNFPNGGGHQQFNVNLSSYGRSQNPNMPQQPSGRHNNSPYLQPPGEGGQYSKAIRPPKRVSPNSRPYYPLQPQYNTNMGQQSTIHYGNNAPPSHPNYPPNVFPFSQGFHNGSGPPNSFPSTSQPPFKRLRGGEVPYLRVNTNTPNSSPSSNPNTPPYRSAAAPNTVSPVMATKEAPAPACMSLKIVEKIVVEGSYAFKSHTIFPLLRDLFITWRDCDKMAVPTALLSALPEDFDTLLQNFMKTNPPPAVTVTDAADLTPAVERVIHDAARCAHKALLQKLTRRPPSAAVSPMGQQPAPLPTTRVHPGSQGPPARQEEVYTAIQEFCDRFEKATKEQQLSPVTSGVQEMAPSPITLVNSPADMGDNIGVPETESCSKGGGGQ
ncbi:Hypp6433 [Branchiostoma lanceolatum]|uniref:Hypp6433 protein n=2 Tax=Branchiostoma lanceolatum TaxID=7740 RepID=A0A8J9YUA0_BRALA|nr:Hypp6433 [Branchiostoma lanceolatum]